MVLIQKNPGAEARYQATKDSRWKTLSGKLKVPFFKTNSLMLNNVPLTIELYRQKSEFTLIDMTGVDHKLSINIRNPILTLSRYKPATESLNVNFKKIHLERIKFSF